ncbi:hypothetical protein TWF106_009873 [Orbilia oligospora]|uniref:Uncharacterized protein n=1 Tax=Orbilia oligospora TaxID=2813651 RepID=A0A6G1MMK5_ORBOL|nr:hypothetical protein TWF788_009418 [Orbilia oligospora]KAF3207122.1 hypothetical protein TWF679_008472 [Orbilia oligospora]KAF3219702.1 hypothetical protein TWF191_007678 [Orbilia oligospora]KAF3227358.1 hypothetical protein TWF106_009873 [Orbilia oligospora]KAF3261816.1 hypothetical protein TWF192_008272 [Orbilia oligospora]
MRFENIITDRTSPDNETILLTVVDNSTFTPIASHQPYLNGTNIKGTPVKAESGRRTNTPTEYGSDYESDDGTNIPDDEHPYGPDDHPPLTVYDFYDSTGYRVELVLRTKRLQPCHINLNVGIAAVLIKVSLFPTRTIGLISIFNGDATPCLFPRRAGLQQVGSQDTSASDIDASYIDMGQMQGSNTPDKVPNGIKKSHEGYIYRRGDGREFRFSPFNLDPNFILEYKLSDWDSDLALRNGDSPAPASKISHSGNRQYLVPGTEEPYYLEGPESKDRLDELQARYGTLDTFLEIERIQSVMFQVISRAWEFPFGIRIGS